MSTSFTLQLKKQRDAMDVKHFVVLQSLLEASTFPYRYILPPDMSTSFTLLLQKQRDAMDFKLFVVLQSLQWFANYQVHAVVTQLEVHPSDLSNPTQMTTDSLGVQERQN